MAFSDPVFEQRRKQVLSGETPTPITVQGGYSNPTFEVRRQQILSQGPRMLPKNTFPEPKKNYTPLEIAKNTLNTVKNATVKIGEGLSVLLVPPKELSPLSRTEEQRLTQQNIVQQKPVQIKPQQTKLNGDQLETALGNFPAQTVLKPAPKRTIWQKFTDRIGQVFDSDQAKKARDINAVAIKTKTEIGRDLPLDKLAEKGGNPLKNTLMEDVTKELGIRSMPTTKEVGETLMILAGGAGLINAPMVTLKALGIFAGVNEVKSALFSAIKGDGFKFGTGTTLGDLFENASPDVKNVLDIVDFVGTGALSHQLYSRYPQAKAPLKQAFERLTKDIITEYNMPKVVNIPAKTVNDVIIGKNTGIEKDLLASLNLKSSEWRVAVKKGISIQVEGEKLIQVTDKPYWAKLKSLIGKEAVNITRTESMGTTKRGDFAGYLPSGEYTPQEVTGAVIAKGLENTPEGKAIIKTALEAQQSGQNVQIINEKNMKPSARFSELAKSKDIDLPEKFTSKTEQDVMQKLTNESDDLVNKYIEKNGNHVNADLGMGMFEGYTGSNTVDYTRAGGNLAKLVYRELLKRNAGTDKPILFTAGGTGSGKSITTLGSKDQYAINFDSTMSDAMRTRGYIDEAVNKGYKVNITYVYRPAERAYTDGVLRRFIEGEERVVPIKTHVTTHMKSPENFKAIYELYKDNPSVEFVVIDNSGGIEDFKEVPIDFLDSIKYNREELTQKLYDHTRQKFESGQLTKEQFRQLTKGLGKEFDQRSKGRTTQEESTDSGSSSKDKLTPSSKTPSYTVGNKTTQDLMKDPAYKKLLSDAQKLKEEARGDNTKLREWRKLQNEIDEIERIAQENTDNLRADLQKKKDMDLRKSDPAVDNLTEENLSELRDIAKGHKTVRSFIDQIRGSASQYGAYSPQLRKYVRPESVILGDMEGLNPDTTITIYRGIATKSISGKKISTGDFVTTDFNDALQYTDSPDKVLSKEVKLKDLIEEYPEEVDISDPENPVSYELIYSPNAKIYKVTDTLLTEIWNEAHEIQRVKEPTENDFSPTFTESSKSPEMNDLLEGKQVSDFEYNAPRDIEIFRGEGKGIGNQTLVSGKYFADSLEFASEYGRVTKYVLPKDALIFDFDKLKPLLLKEGKVLVPEEVREYLLEQGFDATRNTNLKGVEYVIINRKLLDDYWPNKDRFIDNYKTQIQYPSKSSSLLEKDIADMALEYKTPEAFHDDMQKILDERPYELEAIYKFSERHGLPTVEEGNSYNINWKSLYKQIKEIRRDIGQEIFKGEKDSLEFKLDQYIELGIEYYKTTKDYLDTPEGDKQWAINVTTNQLREYYNQAKKSLETSTPEESPVTKDEIVNRAISIVNKELGEITPLQQARVSKMLDKKIRNNGKIQTKKEFLLEELDRGGTLKTVQAVDSDKLDKLYKKGERADVTGISAPYDVQQQYEIDLKKAQTEKITHYRLYTDESSYIPLSQYEYRAIRQEQEIRKLSKEIISEPEESPVTVEDLKRMRKEQLDLRRLETEGKITNTELLDRWNDYEKRIQEGVKTIRASGIEVTPEELILKPTEATETEDIIKEVAELELGPEVLKHTYTRTGEEVISYKKPSITKADIKLIVQNSPEFKKNPVFVVDEDKNLRFKGDRLNLVITPEQMQLAKENLKVGDKIRVDIPSVMKKGSSQMRVMTPKGVYASQGASPMGAFENRFSNEKTEKENFKLFEEVNKLIQKYAKTVGEGYLPRGTAGVYFSDTANIRVNGMNNLSVASHEISHFLDYHYHISDKIMQVKGSTSAGNPIYDRDTKGFRKEMTAVYTTYYPGGRKDHSLKLRMIEGFATLLQKYAEMPTTIEKQFPNLVNAFLKPGGEYYKPVMGEILKDLENIITEYQGLSSLDKIGARVTNQAIETKEKEFMNIWEKIRTVVEDEIYPIEKLSKVSGTHFTGEDPSIWLRSFQNASGIYANNIMNSHTGYYAMNAKGEFIKKFDFNWKNLLDGLYKEKTIDSFGNYLVARDQYYEWKELDVLREKFEELKAMYEEIKAMGEDPADTIGSDGKKFIEELKEAGRNYQAQMIYLKKNGMTRQEVTRAYMENKTRFMPEETMYDALVRQDLELLHNENVQLIGTKTYDELRVKEGYASMKRKIYDDILGDEDPVLKVPGGVKASSMKRRTGGEQAIINPVLNGMTNHIEIMRKSMKQAIYNKVADIAVKAKMPEFFQRVPLKTAVEDNGRITFPQERDSNIIMARIGYKRVPILTDKFIKNSIDQVLTYQALNIFEHFMVTSSRAFTAGTTALYVPFTVTNFAVDQWSAVQNTRNNFTPVVDQFNVAVKALHAKITRQDSEISRIYNQWSVLGGDRMTLYQAQFGSMDQALKYLKTETSNIQKVLDMIDTGVDIVSTPARLSETATRFSEFYRAIKAGKHQLVALEEAGRVSAPFHHIGSWRIKDETSGKNIVRSVPFMNATIQALGQTIRTAETPEGRRRIFTLMALMVALGLSSLAMVSQFGTDDQKEQYKDLTSTDLAQYLYFPAIGKETGLYRIKVSSQLATISTLMQMILMQNMYGVDYTVNDYKRAIAGSNLPDQFNIFEPVRLFISWMPPIIKVPFELIANIKDYPEIRPLESMSMKYQEPKNRYNEYTSELAKKIGEVFNISPIKVDFVMEGLGSRFVRYFTAKPGAYNVESTVYREYYFTMGRRVEKYYKESEKIDQRYRTLSDKLKSGEILTPEEKVEAREVVRKRAIYNLINERLKIMRKLDPKEDTEAIKKQRDAILDLFEKVELE